MLWNSVPFLGKSFSKAFAISEEDLMCPTTMFCLTDTCCFDYQSNDKASHSGKMMSPGVRKSKWHKLRDRLFTIFLFQKLNTDIAVVYHQKKKKKKRNASQFLEKSVKVKDSLKFSCLRISFH